MVKSPNLLRGLLDKKVDRRRILEIAGFTGAVAALAACSGETTENQERSKQVPNPNTTPKPDTEVSTPEVVARPVDVREIVSPEKIAEVCSLPNFNTINKKNTIDGVTNDEATKNELISRIVKMFNYVTNPNLFNTDDQDVQVPSMASWSKREVAAGDMESYAGDPRLSIYLIEGLREHATDALPQYKEGMAEVMD